MAIGNGELVQECFFQTLSHGDSKNEIRQRQTKTVRRDALSVEKSKTGIKKEVPTATHYLIKIY